MQASFHFWELPPGHRGNLLLRPAQWYKKYAVFRSILFHNILRLIQAISTLITSFAKREQHQKIEFYFSPFGKELSSEVN